MDASIELIHAILPSEILITTKDYYNCGEIFVVSMCKEGACQHKRPHGCVRETHKEQAHKRLTYCPTAGVLFTEKLYLPGIHVLSYSADRKGSHIFENLESFFSIIYSELLLFSRNKNTKVDITVTSSPHSILHLGYHNCCSAIL